MVNLPQGGVWIINASAKSDTFLSHLESINILYANLMILYWKQQFVSLSLSLSRFSFVKFIAEKLVAILTFMK